MKPTPTHTTPTPPHTTTPNPLPQFAPRLSVKNVEEGAKLAPNTNNLLIGVASDADTGEVLMTGFLNQHALQLAVASGYMHWWSRARQAIWKKGETSGMTQKIVELRIDDDQDAVWAKVRIGGIGASCHVGYRSCFFRRIIGVGGGWSNPVQLEATETKKMFQPEIVYKGKPNPTKL